MAIKTDVELTAENEEVAIKHDDRFSYTTHLKNFLKNFIDSKERILGNPDVNGKVSSSTTDGVRSWVTAGGSGTATIIDITYANLVIAITNSTLTKGSWYRITDFATVHNILTSSPNVVNTGTTEPLIVFATGINTLAEQAFSELYPQDVIRYEVANTKMAGATKGVILFRHDTDKNISCFYDWRNVKNRDYGQSFSSTAFNIGSGVRLKTVDTGAVSDKYTFEDSQNPSNTNNVTIGLLSENNRINNLVINSNFGAYTRNYKNIIIADGCSNIRIGTYTIASIDLKNISIGSGSSNIFLIGLVGGGKIGQNCNKIRWDISFDNNNFIIENNVNEIWGNKNAFIGSGSNNITVDSFSTIRLTIDTNCFNLYIKAETDKVTFDSNCSDIQILSTNTFSDVYFGAGFNNKIFNTGITNSINCKYLISNTTSKTFTTAPASALVFDKVDSAGDLWATSIDTAGVISQVKMV